MRAIHITLLGTLLLAGLAAHAAIPGSLSYQAYLTDPDGSPIDRNVMVTFSVYNVDIGGSPLWTDTQVVSVDQGLMSIELGNPANTFPTGLFNAPLWLGIRIDGDAEMLPRRPLTSVGFAFEADNAATLQGQGATVFDQSFHVADMANPHGVDADQVGAASAADVAALQSRLDGALASIASMQAVLTAANNSIATLQTDLAGETAARIAADNAEEAARLAADAAQNATIAGIGSNTVLQLDGALSLSGGDTALFTGVNLQIVNGTGTTDGDPNGVGNLIVGYDAPDTADDPICSAGAFTDEASCNTGGAVWAVSHKSGSHNVVVGDEHNYSRFGGIVVGLDNNITGDWASVSGGHEGTASGSSSSVSGGYLNFAGFIFEDNIYSETGMYASVSGGQENRASGQSASVSGGINNVVSELAGSISGGESNGISSDYFASGSFRGSSISGGYRNSAGGGFASWTSVCGGMNNHAGTMGDTDRAEGATVCGGAGNEARGVGSTVSGGSSNTALSEYAEGASIFGGHANLIDNIGVRSAPHTVVGGYDNYASGEASNTIVGGVGNRTLGNGGTITGGSNNTTDNLGFAPTIVGGDDVTCSSDVCGEGIMTSPD